MKKLPLILIFAASAFCLIFSSCSSGNIIRPADSLLSPPLYYEEYADLVEAFNQKVNTEVIMCHPQSGDYRSAIVVEDIDSDGESEALVFYKKTDDPTVARMHLLDYIDGRWISRNDFNGYGTAVESLRVDDMDLDGAAELMVTWNTSASKVLSLYRTLPRIGSYKEISNENCFLSELVDIDGDGRKELFLISQSNSTGVANRVAKAMKISGESVVLLGETKLDSNISSYANVKTEKASDEEPMRIYVDALKGEHQMITELVYWDSSKSELCAPFLDPETMTNIVTLRYEPIGCADVNNDGIIDIPVQSKIFGKGDNKLTIDTENIYLTEWTDYISSEFSVVAYALINNSDGYMITLSKNELDQLGIRNYRSQNCWIVYNSDVEGNSKGEMFSVLKIPKEKWNPKTYGAYISIVEKDDGVVCVYITQTGKSFGVSEELIKQKITKIPS